MKNNTSSEICGHLRDLRMASSAFFVYVGTYTGKGSKGIYLCRFDAASGALECVGKAAGRPNPTFLAIDPKGTHLYSVSEKRGFFGRRGSSVNAFALDPGTGTLTVINRQPSGGSGPCHVAVDREGRCVVVANYASGSVALFPVLDGGGLGEASDVRQHHGSSADHERQAGPHTHSVTFSPDNRFAFAADLGLDKIMIYRLDASDGKLVPHDPPWSAVRPGSGPRHFAFHPNSRFAYLVNELSSTMTVFAYDAERAVLAEIQTLSALPADFKGASYCADVHVAASGRFVYASNRGHDSIAVFRVDEESGMVSVVGHDSTEGKWPRSFVIDPTGDFLLAANQDGDSIVVFRLSDGTGRLTPTGHTVSLSKPVCLKMVPAS